MTNADKLTEAIVSGNHAGAIEIMNAMSREEKAMRDELWDNLTKCKAFGCDNRAAHLCDGYCKQCSEEIDCLDEGR